MADSVLVNGEPIGGGGGAVSVLASGMETLADNTAVTANTGVTETADDSRTFDASIAFTADPAAGVLIENTSALNDQLAYQLKYTGESREWGVRIANTSGVTVDVNWAFYEVQLP